MLISVFVVQDLCTRYTVILSRLKTHMKAIMEKLSEDGIECDIKVLERLNIFQTTYIKQYKSAN